MTFPTPDGDVLAVRDVSITVRRGEIVGIVGESGSGKSVTALAIAQLVSYPGEVTVAQLRFDGRDLAALRPGERRRLLGTTLPMVFQNPGTTLNPALRVGRQLAEVSEVHDGMGRAEATRRAADKLGAVAIAAPERRLRSYPHELSGGMKQRAVIAMGLMGRPKLFVADEPTTALDVTVQRQILDLLQQVNRDEGAAVVFISHDISAVAELCGRIVVMYGGRIVEEVGMDRVGDGCAAHPYTRALLAAVPDLSVDRQRPLTTIAGRPPDPRRTEPGCAFAPRRPRADERCRVDRPPLGEIASDWRVACWHPHTDGVDSHDPASGDGMTLLSVREVSVGYGAGRTAQTAVDCVSLDVPAGSVVGLLGESGSGKTTLAKAIVGLVPVTGGEITLDGETISGAGRGAREHRRRVQMVFQDPYSSLDPRMTIGESIAEALPNRRRLGRAGCRDEIARLLELVSLEPAVCTAKPRQLSGGQLQRISIARALAARPACADRRRDHVVARRLGAGRRAQRRSGGPRRACADDALHQPQRRRRPLHQRRDRGDAQRPDRRGRAHRHVARRPAARVHPAAARGRPRRRPLTPRVDLVTLLLDIENLGDQIAVRDAE